MLFNSLAFALFFPTVFALYLLLPHRWQNRLLLCASYVFYGSWDWRFLSLILASTVVDAWCGAAIHATEDPARRRRLLGVSLLTNLGLLGAFKYFGFFATSFAELAGMLGLPVGEITLRIVLPVGISFYTFQTLSYTLDVYWRRIEPERSFLDFALFVAFFPQLVAGPIERASHLLPQIRSPRTVDARRVADGLWLVFWGYFLKVFVADNLAPLVDGVFDAPSAPTGLATLVAVYAFAFQIFGDFAGYSSIAVGVARMMGFELSTNFLFPYFVTNPRDFWRNWHVSLSTWLRDYLYIPLGGNRGTRTRVSRNLLLTMLLGGLWHGAAWSFVLWGAYQGALLIGHRWIDTLGSPIASRLPPALERPWRVAKVVGMFHLTCLGWLIFRSTSVARVGSMLKAVLTAPGPLSHAVVLSMLQLVFFTWLMLAVQLLMRRSPDIARIDGVPEPARVGILAAMLYSLVVWGSYGGTELIYFQF